MYEVRKTDKNICGGAVIIRGKNTNVKVAQIIRDIKDDISWEDVCIYYGITMQDIEDCIDYTIQFIKNDMK